MRCLGLIAALVILTTGVASSSTIPGPGRTLRALQRIPVDRLPAAVIRGANAERGTLTLGLPGGARATGLVRSDSVGRIGTVVRRGTKLVFRFSRITYRVGPIVVFGRTIDPQRIGLDQSQPRTFTVDLRTGKITRRFHWLLTATNAEYDGKKTLPLADSGQSGVASVKKIGRRTYVIRLLTAWRSGLTLRSWSVNGEALPGGKVEARASFDGRYRLTFP